VPSTTDLRWRFEAKEHRVERHLGRERLYLRGGTAIAEGVRLEHGVFEFDMAFPPGRDELVLAVSEDFGGWGVEARFPDPAGLTLEG
jgi:hypothetical protein